jgi:signal transduction histidine kinase
MKFLSRQGIRLRLGLLYLSIFAVGLSVFCAVLYQFFEATQLEAFDTTLFNFAVDVSSNLEMDFIGRLFVVNSNSSEAEKLFPFHVPGSFLEIRDTQGRSLLHSRSLGPKGLPFDHDSLLRVINQKAVFNTVSAASLGVQSSSKDLRLLTYWAQRKEWQQPLILQIAVPLDWPIKERRNLLLFFFFSIPTFLLIAGIAGVWMSRRALRPVHNITVKARGITGVGNLKERIPVPLPPDEIRELAETFNGLLERLDKAFASQDRFIANASHQLRTPLTILKGEVDLLRKGVHLDGPVKDGLESVGVEINRLIQLVQDLLLLARLEAGHDTIAFSPLRLDEVLLRVVARLQKLALNKQVQIATQFSAESPGSELDVEVQGDEDLLDSMFENFIENAVKYAPAGSTVELSMKVSSEAIVVSIRDSGPGIPLELRQKIFERFTRVQPSHIVPGSGLGLSIAAEIASLHKVQIDLASNPGQGTEVTLTIERKNSDFRG